jgi:hypothetical protein
MNSDNHMRGMLQHYSMYVYRTGTGINQYYLQPNGAKDSFVEELYHHN